MPDTYVWPKFKWKSWSAALFDQNCYRYSVFAVGQHPLYLVTLAALLTIDYKQNPSKSSSYVRFCCTGTFEIKVGV